MIYYVTEAKQQDKTYYRGQYKTLNNAIRFSKKDLSKMVNACIITGNKNNVEFITMFIYKVENGVKHLVPETYFSYFI